MANLRVQDLSGGFVDAAFGALLQSLAAKQNVPQSRSVGQVEGEDILSLGASLGESTIKANAELLAYVLLKHWIAMDPDDAYRAKVMAQLLDRIGDPR